MFTKNPLNEKVNDKTEYLDDFVEKYTYQDGKYFKKGLVGVVQKALSNAKLKKIYSKLSMKDSMDLTAKEVRVIKDYTLTGFRDINSFLYAQEQVYYNEYEKKWLKSKIDILTECINKRILGEQGIFYRGLSHGRAIFGSDVLHMSLEELKKKYEGKKLINPGFSSVSVSKHVAENFSGGENGVILEIALPKDTRALCVGSVGSYGKEEEEFILQRGTCFTIDKISYRDGKFRVKITAVGVYY